MTWQTILYFTSILLICTLTGFLFWYVRRQPALPGVRTFGWMVLSECLLALTEMLSMLGGTQEQALFWFNARVIFIAIIPVLWLKFALEYNGRKDWLSKQLTAGAFIVPLITQGMLWSNSLHGLWVKQEVAFHQNGLFWIAQTSARIPGLWFMVHSFYSMILLLAGVGVLLLTAWQKREDYRGQAVLISVGALISLATTVIAVFNLLPQSEFNPFVPGIGISVLMYALAIFRFQFLKRVPAQENTPRLINLEPHEKSSVAILVFIFILLASSIAAASYFTYQNYERQFRAQVENQLSAISALKVDTLQDWRNERLEDANLFYQNENFSERVRKVLEDPQDTEARVKLLTWMKKVQASPEYDRIFLLDVQGVEQISIPAAPEAVPQNLVEQASASLESDQIIFLDFHRHSDSDAAHLSILVPIFNAQNNQPLGTLVLRINPNIYLYPFIQRWPVPSQSAETLLIRRDGNDILYLNDLKFEPDAAINLRMSLENENVPAVKAALGFEGIVTGVDYRGAPVITDVRAVPNSPWFLISKVDSAEVDAPLRARLMQTIFFFGMMILITGAGLLLIWRQQRVRFYRGKVEAAEALHASEEKFRLAFDTSPDSVAITRVSDGMFVSVNKGFEQISGYTREQAIGKTSAEINIWKDPEDRRKVVEALRAKGEVQNYEAPFLTRSGEIYGMMSAAIIELNGEPHILNIVHDITERKRVEEKLIVSETRYRRLFEAARDGILIMDAETGIILDANPFLIEMLGFPLEEFVGKELWELGFFKDIAANKDNFLELQQKEYIRYEDLPLETANGQKFHVEFVSNVYQVNHHKVIQCNIRDITERKKAEDAMRDSEEKFRQAFNTSPIAISISRLKGGGFVSINKSFERFTGYSEAEVIGKTAEELNLWQSPEVHQSLIKELRANGEMRDYETPILTRNGEIYCLMSASLIEFNGEPHILTMTVDITERKQAEEQIKKQLEELRRWYNATLGRESRVLELKHEVNHLLKQTGLPPRYPSAELQDQKEK